MLSPFDGGIDQQKYGGGSSNQQNALIFWCSGPRMALSSACNRNKELKCQTLALKHRTWGVKKHTWEYLPTKRVQGILTDWWVFLTNQKMGFPFKKWDDWTYQVDPGMFLQPNLEINIKKQKQCC